MSWGVNYAFPKAILHIDGDSFFVACEIALNPLLRGKPVVTGKERGIASAMSYEAKMMGVTRGMSLAEIVKVCPDVIMLPSNYETYSLFSERMFTIVRRYTPQVEEYSIDECFADVTGLRRLLRLSYEGMAVKIKEDLQRELGLTFSVGLGPTKVLAKLGSNFNKPNGLTFIPRSEAPKFLAETKIEKIWGIGPQTAAFLNKYGIKTALDFTNLDDRWVQKNLAKPYQEIWTELKGQSVYEVGSGKKSSYKSIQKTKTFTPASTNRAFVLSQLSKNVENACIKARRHGLAANRISFFVKSQEFRFRGTEIKMGAPTDKPIKVMQIIEKHFDRIFIPGTSYRATGVSLSGLQEKVFAQLDFFGEQQKEETLVPVFEGIDSLDSKFGKHTVFLGSSMQAITNNAHQGQRGDPPMRNKMKIKGETVRRRIGIPMMGEVL